MMGLAIAALIVVVLGFLIWLTVKAVDGSVLAGAAAFGLATAILGVVLNA